MASASEYRTRRDKIDKMLEKAGWLVRDRTKVYEEVDTKQSDFTAGKYKTVSQTLKDPEEHAYADYLLLDDKGMPLAVIEAKKTSKDPILGQRQAEGYVDDISKQTGQPIFIFLTNGYEIWFWNKPFENPRIIKGFHDRKALERLRFQNYSKKEADVEDEIQEISSKAKGLSICNWSVRDTDRMLSFLNVAKKLGKKLAISLKQAYLLDELAKCGDSVAPKTDDDNLQLYANRKSWGVIGDSKWCDKIRDEDYESWERPYLDRAVCYKDVGVNQEDYLMFCSNFDLKELVDIKPVEGSVYIKSVCEPFDAEMEMDWERVMNWINHFGISVESTHVSGHASGPQLKEFVEQVNAKNVIPLHTENAKAFEKWAKNVTLLGKIGDRFTF